MIDARSDAFVRKGLQLVVDGSEPDAIRSITRSGAGRARARRHARGEGVRGHGHLRADARHHRRRARPDGRDAEPRRPVASSGHGIAAAFTATVYGIGLANLFFLPMAGKLKGIVAEQTQVREMVIEGLISIAQGENPRSIESKLHGYCTNGDIPRFLANGDAPRLHRRPATPWRHVPVC